MQTWCMTGTGTATSAGYALESAVMTALTKLFPKAWTVRAETGTEPTGDPAADIVVNIEDGRSFGRLVVDVKQNLDPRDVASIVSRLNLTRRLDLRVEHLVAARWL